MRVTIGENKYDIPTSWRSLTFRRYLATLDHWSKSGSDGGNPVDYLSAVTGIDKDILKQTNVQGLSMIFKMLDFIADPKGLEPFNRVEPEFAAIDIGDQPYWKLEMCNQEVKRVWGECYPDKKELDEAEVMHVYMKASPVFVKVYTENIEIKKGVTLFGRFIGRKKNTGEGVDILDLPVSTVYGLAVFFCNELRSLTLNSMK